MIDKEFENIFSDLGDFENLDCFKGKSEIEKLESNPLDLEVSKCLDKKYLSNMESESNIDFDSIIEYASAVKASDIHLTVDSKPAVRLNKVMKDIADSTILDNYKIKGILKQCMDDELWGKMEKDGEVDFSFEWKMKNYFRANAFKQKNNYALVLRRIPVEIPAFDDLKLPRIIKEFANEHKGLVLITGATGSGKSTTMASLIDIINSQKRQHIITIEDPIEYVHKHNRCKINQREVGSDTKSFASALKAALREDPDVILVGEMRDPETIATALTAAETGHLVFSTLHTIGAAKTIDRIIDTFPPEKHSQIQNQLSTVLRGIVSQELIPKLNNKGVVAASEIMVINSAIANLIREGKSFQIDSVIQTSSSEGMITMDQSLADLTLSGVISQNEAELRSINKEYYKTLLQKGRL